MDHVHLNQNHHFGYGFLEQKYIPKGKDEFYIREEQRDDKNVWRHLTSDEIEYLVKLGNRSDNWDDIWVTDFFEPHQIMNSTFHGKNRIGRVHKATLEHHDLQVPVGISNSTIISSDIGDDSAIHNVRYMSHVIVGDQCILMNIEELHTTNHAKFGNGVLKQGESEDVRIWLDVMNETGSRRVLPFDGMIPADAYLWAKYRDDKLLQQQFKVITDKQFDTRRGFYGTIGNQTVIKHCRILKDVKIGSHCYIKGANKLKNLTINSNAEERTQIGEGVELVNGIIGNGCHIFYGSKAVRFILGNNSHLKYGARLIHSFLGPNSTISCCEVLNNLIFPAHEQHHNNSFLIASVVMGQSNLAAGATIGSNHNSRANDNEVEAGRGFWPGLCSSIKHSCKFASFILLAKGAYPAEMNIPLPFSLLNNNESKNQLEVMPAFWWLYNMYALARNTWKFQSRDKRKTKAQHIEFDSLAPDTAEEMIEALQLLELWTAKAYLKSQNRSVDTLSEKKLKKLGASLLSEQTDVVKGLTVLGENMEKSKRPVLIINTHKAYKAYLQMLHIYAIRNIQECIESQSIETLNSLHKRLVSQRVTKWINLGGQLCPEKKVDQLRKEINIGKLKSWDQIHDCYDQLWEKYLLEKQKHAYAVLCYLCKTPEITQEIWMDVLNEAIQIQQYICNQVYETRKKDYENPFRKATYRNEEEMTAAIGTVEDNGFIQQIRAETKAFEKKVRHLKRLSE